MFRLHPRLQADSFFVCRLPLSEVRLINDQRFPWVILIPQRDEITELHQLAFEDQVQLLAESGRLAKLLSRLFEADKINVAALGNMVPQLHWHVVARKRNDPAWPGPVWGYGAPISYTQQQQASVTARLQDQLLAKDPGWK